MYVGGRNTAVLVLEPILSDQVVIPADSIVLRGISFLFLSEWSVYESLTTDLYADYGRSMQ